MRVAAVNRGLAPDIQTAMQAGIQGSWAYDFGRLYDVACPPDERIGRSALFGSRPPPNDSLWQRARDNGFEVFVHDRNVAGREKQVDNHINTVMIEDSYEFMLPGRDTAVLSRVTETSCRRCYRCGGADSMCACSSGATQAGSFASRPVSLSISTGISTTSRCDGSCCGDAIRRGPVVRGRSRYATSWSNTRPSSTSVVNALMGEAERVFSDHWGDSAAVRMYRLGMRRASILRP